MKSAATFALLSGKKHQLITIATMYCRILQLPLWKDACQMLTKVTSFTNI